MPSSSSRSQSGPGDSRAAFSAGAINPPVPARSFPLPEISRLAAEEWEWRSRAARALISRNEWTGDRAREQLAPWAAMALLCGVDACAISPDVADALADLRVIQVFCKGDGSPPQYGKTRPEPEARELLASQLCPAMRWAHELQRAIVKAMDAHTADPTEANLQRLKRLAKLSGALDVPMPVIETRSTTSGPQGRPPVRSGSGKAGNSREDARADARAEDKNEREAA